MPHEALADLAQYANASPMSYLIRGGAIWPILSGEVPMIGQKAVTGWDPLQVGKMFGRSLPLFVRFRHP
jgi:hypothetical protein